MDAALTELLRQGKRTQALERMVDLYGSKVLGMATVMLRDRGRAEEVTEDIFLKLWQVLPAYDGRASPSTWLYTVARNNCLSAIRSESYRRMAPLAEVPEPASPRTVPAAEPIHLEPCLSGLPAGQQDGVS